MTSNTATTVEAAVAEALPVLADNAAGADRNAAFPLESLAALRRSGLMALMVPAGYGGTGGDLGDLVSAAQQLAAGCLSTAFAWVMHCQQVDAIARYGTESLRDRLLPRIAQQGAYIASVTAERATGGQLLRADEALAAEDGGYRLVRAAPVVTGGAHADGFLVKMRTDPAAAADDVSLVYVDRDQVEAEVGPGWDALGMRATENVALMLRGMVPADQVVGGLGGSRQVVVEAFAPAIHLGWSACWLGAARAAFSALLREIRSGERLRVDVRSELVAQRIGGIRGRLELVSGYLHAVLAEVQDLRRRNQSLAGTATQIHLNTLKVAAAQETYQAADSMVALGGLRLGYREDGPVPLARLLRDLRAASLTFDDNLLLMANGRLCVMDPAVTTIGEQRVE